jgi:acyl-CoA hydrolase
MLEVVAERRYIMAGISEQRAITLRFLAEPTEVNFGGKVHGGTVMKWIDQAGYTCAVGWSGQYCVTVYVGGIRFYHPIHIGDVVEVHAKLIYTGTTSMHIAVDVRAGDPKTRQMQTTTHCIIIFVAIGTDGRPTLHEGIEEEMRPYIASQEPKSVQPE